MGQSLLVKNIDHVLSFHRNSSDKSKNSQIQLIYTVFQIDSRIKNLSIYFFEGIIPSISIRDAFIEPN